MSTQSEIEKYPLFFDGTNFVGPNIKSVVYCWINTTNNKLYIGYTTKYLKQRCIEHIRGASPFGVNHLKGSVSNFKCYIIDHYCNEDLELNPYVLGNLEMDYIGIFGTHYKDGFGYNKTYGGDFNFGFRHTEESKRKISEAGKGRASYVRTDEQRLHLSKIRKGKPNPKLKNRVFSDEHRRKLSLAMAGKKRKPFTTEHKTKIKNAILSLPPRSEEWCNNISNGKKGKLCGANHPMYGVKRPDVAERNRKRSSNYEN